MVKGILIESPFLFDKSEELEIKERFSKYDIEVGFLDKNVVKADIFSSSQLILSSELVKDLMIGIAVDLLKDLFLPLYFCYFYNRKSKNCWQEK